MTISEQTLRILMELAESNPKLFNEGEYIEVCNFCRDEFIAIKRRQEMRRRIEIEEASSTTEGGESYIGDQDNAIGFIPPPDNFECTDNYNCPMELGDFIKPIHDPLHPELLGNTSCIMKILYIGFMNRRLADIMDEPGYIVQTPDGYYPAFLVRKTLSLHDVPEID